MTLGDLILSLIREGDKISDKSQPLREPAKEGKMGKNRTGVLNGSSPALMCLILMILSMSSMGTTDQEPSRDKLRAHRNKPTSFLARGEQARLDRLRIMNGKDQMKVLTLMKTLLFEMCEEMNLERVKRGPNRRAR